MLRSKLSYPVVRIDLRLISFSVPAKMALPELLEKKLLLSDLCMD